MSNRATNNPDHHPKINKRKSNILIIGVGNRFRSDDAIGLIVAEELKKKNLPHIEITEHSGEGASLMETWKTYQTVILIDAVSSGAPPGTIHQLDAQTQTIPSDFFHYSSHAFSVAEAIELARITNSLPKKLIIYGIEGKQFNAGVMLTPPVSSSINSIIALIENHISIPEID